ncbi:hypothetical protein D3C74_389570 [compost metagenome]
MPDMYIVSFCPVAERGSKVAMTSRSAHDGMMRSMPISVICVFGTVDTIRALPSFSNKTIEPVSAIAKLQPVRPISASKNFSRNFLRTNPARTVVSGSSTSPASLDNNSAI